MKRLLVSILLFISVGLNAQQYPALGEQKTLIALVYFADRPVPTLTQSQVKTAAFTASNSLNAFWSAASFGQTQFTGDVTSWIKLPSLHFDGCNPSRWILETRAELDVRGYNLDNYDRFIIVTGTKTNCTATGISAVGGGLVVLFGGISAMKHEVGHNLGLWHSHGEACGQWTAGKCVISEYSATDDIMGNSIGALPNAYHLDRLGMRIPLLVTESGDYFISPYSTPEDAFPKSLKISLSDDRNLYIEYRVKVGFDYQVSAGVKVHTGSSGDTSILKDLNLGSPNDFILNPGQSYSIDGITVTTLTADASGALIHVEF